MRANIKADRRWRQALISAVLSAACQLGTAVLLLWLRRDMFPTGLFSAILLILALADVVLLVPLGLSLRQRYDEILGGEEDAARDY